MSSLFHCTRRENLSSILKEGLIPHVPDEIPDALCGVYLSLHPFEWMYWATDENKYAGALIELDVTDLDLLFNVTFSHQDKSIPEVISVKRIPVERFVRISVSSNEHPCKFEEFDFRG